jgi:phosphoribosylformimino-5-aminoimidazole carboxamide ribonucleotide (ProFAR) isomerase
LSKPFLLLPAIDIFKGEVRRPIQGNISDEQNFGPAEEVVKQFVSTGCKWIHIVDLDLAFGTGNNQELIASIIRGFPAVSFQLSGGIADESTFYEATKAGAKRINLASQALANRAWLANALSVSDHEISFALDVFEDRVVARGTKTDFGALSEVLHFLAGTKVRVVSVTDVERDGMLSGPNLDLLAEVSNQLGFPVTNSGGIASLSDLEVLVSSEFCDGAILGKALYTQSFSLEDAMRVVS